MSARGHNRERQVRLWLEERDFVVVRAAGSLGPCDLVAMKSGVIWFLEVKSTAGGPYEHFGRQDRADMLAFADRAGAAAWLAWWPPRGKLHLISAAEWPKLKAAA